MSLCEMVTDVVIQKIREAGDSEGLAQFYESIQQI